jgi:hypothetical protein
MKNRRKFSRKAASLLAHASTLLQITDGGRLL